MAGTISIATTGQLYGVFTATPWALEPASFWRTVYGYIHSRVALSVAKPDLEAYARILAEELEAVWLAPYQVLSDASKALILERLFTPPVFTAAQTTGGTETGSPQLGDGAMSDKDAHDSLMRLTLGFIFVDGHSIVLATHFIAHGIKWMPTHDDVQKMFLLPLDKRERVSYALSFTPEGEIRTMRMVEALLRTDNVTALEARGHLPRPSDLKHALEVRAFKVVRRVLDKRRGNDEHNRTWPSDVRMALDMGADDIAEMMLSDLTLDERGKLLLGLATNSSIRTAPFQIILDSVPTDVLRKDAATPQEYQAMVTVRQLFVLADAVQEHQGEGGKALPPEWLEKLRDVMRMMLTRYNMVDATYPEWFERAEGIQLGAEARANRARFADTLKARKLKARKDAIRLKSGRGGGSGGGK
jgi:hypothetical protein